MPHLQADDEEGKDFGGFESQTKLFGGASCLRLREATVGKLSIVLFFVVLCAAVGLRGGINLYGYVGDSPSTPAGPSATQAQAGTPAASKDVNGSFADSMGIEWTTQELQQKQKEITECCQNGGIQRKAGNRFEITLWAPSDYVDDQGAYPMIFGHGSFAANGSPAYGFHPDGFENDTESMKGFGVHSVWECCGLSDEEMEKLKGKINEVADKIKTGDKTSFEGENYWILSVLGSPPYATCFGQCASFATGLGCPNLQAEAGGGAGGVLEEVLKSNKYCRLKEKGPNFEKPFVYKK